MKIDRGSKHLRVGRFIVLWGEQQTAESPWLDTGVTTVSRHDDRTDELVETEHFGVLVVSPPHSRQGVAVGAKDWRAPYVHRWRWRFARERLVWRLGHRCPGVSMTFDGETEPTPMASRPVTGEGGQ